MHKPIILAAIAALAVTPAAALAKDNGKGHGKGHAKSQAYVVTPGGEWAIQNGAWVNPGGRTHPHGMPPGQAKKIAKARGDLVVGNVLPSSYPGYRTVDNYSAYTLPTPPAGYEYVRVGNDVYMRQSTSGVIANIIGDLFR